MPRIELSQIFIYPVKSLAGISLESSVITPSGLRYDRRWMIVNEKGLFVTQRLHPELSLIKTAIYQNYIQLTTPDDSTINLPLEITKGDVTPVRVWNDIVEGITAGPEHNRWISQYLGIDTKLVYMPETTIRLVDQEFAKSADDRVSFADGFPFLLLSESSLDDLNFRLEGKDQPAITIHRFRPNLVVRGCHAYDEDNWPDFKIGNNRFHGVKPCSRCIMTTVDPSVGKKGTEPLKTLLEYRKNQNKAYFGQNILIDLGYKNTWKLKVGDSINI